MATIFVSAVDGNNADTGADWANAKQTVAGALAIAGTGDIILVDNAGNFTATAAITWTISAINVAIISVNRSGGDAWATGAAESVGASSNAFAITVGGPGRVFVYGMTINGGTNNSTACDIRLADATTSGTMQLESCTFDLKSASASAQFGLGYSGTGASTPHLIKLRNCTLICSGSRAGTLATINHSEIEIVNLAVSLTGGTKPAVLFAGTPASSTSHVSNATIRDSDLSGYNTAAGAYFDVTDFNLAKIIVRNCKLSSTPSLVTGSWILQPASITIINCDSGDTINTFEYRNPYGTLTENGSIYAASGASFNGAGVSWEVVTTAACGEFMPFVLPPITVWNTVTTAQTATVEFVKDGATDLTDREIWLELEYPASSSFPNYTSAMDRNANPFTGAAVDQPNSATSWIGTGGFANEDKQTADVAFTAAEVGLLRGVVSIGKASTTLYVDPKLRVA